GAPRHVLHSDLALLPGDLRQNGLSDGYRLARWKNIRRPLQPHPAGLLPRIAPRWFARDARRIGRIRYLSRASSGRRLAGVSDPHASGEAVGMGASRVILA